MKNKHLILLIIAVIAILAIVVTISSLMSDKPIVTPSPVTTEPNVDEEVPEPGTIVTEKIEERYYTMDLEYPRSSDNELKEIGVYVKKVKDDFLDLAPQDEADALEMDVNEDRAYNLKMETTVYTSSTTITYKIETYMFTGGAHGGTFISTFTYNRNGTLITLDDLLAAPDSLERLSSAARTHFYDKLSNQTEREVIDAGTEPRRENFNTWYVTDSHITFIFQQYQIGPYALGVQEFPMSRGAARAFLTI